MADKAILFGINDYASISDLRGCENDVESIKKLLMESCGFKEANIHSFTNEDVVKSTIEREFAWLAEGTGPGDRLVFHYSGHGSYTASESSDKTIDELICLYDMDWDNPDSFIRDTDLGKLTRTVNTGARLTVILDSCHSGSGTRAVRANLLAARTISPKTRLIIVEDTANQLAREEGAAVDHRDRLLRSDAATLRSLRRTESPPVYARFVQPPEEIQQLRARQGRRLRKLGESLRAELNHQLLAAAEDTQTAADAYINGDYHGAFTYYFTEASRQMVGSGTYTSILEATRHSLKTYGYSQNPQLDGPFASELLFGGSVKTPDGDSPPAPFPADQGEEGDWPAAESASEQPASPHSAASPLKTLDRLLRVSEKLIDLASGQVQTTAPASQRLRADLRETIVYVHGISTHLPDYSLPWYEALRPHLSRQIPRREVRWSQLVNSRTAGEVVLPGEAQRLREEIQEELDRRAERLETQARQVVAETGAVRQVQIVRPRDLSIDDFTRYMVSAPTREAILEEFRTIVLPLLQSGHTLHVVSHSWGTVVAYEGLRRLDGQSFPGHVANLFVVGSALSIGAVRSNLFSRVGEGRMPTLVRRLINLDAGGDIVGGPIGEHFFVTQEFLGLPPVGCATIPFTSKAWNPSCAHSSYFRKENLAVNREIFARFIG